MTELKPCPFCGGKAYVQEHLSGLYRSVICKVCCAATRMFQKEKEAIEAWNRRASE